MSCNLLTSRNFTTFDAKGCQMNVKAFIVKDSCGKKVNSECRYMAMGEVANTLRELKNKVAKK